LRFRIVAPGTFQWATLQEHRSPKPRTVL
jgi:hypothetical protein